MRPQEDIPLAAANSTGFNQTLGVDRQWGEDGRFQGAEALKSDTRNLR